MECSNRGTCSRSTGTCSCLAGFTGAACDRISCPSNCNGRGTCEPLWRLAELTEENGDSTSYTYGDTLGVLTTWDHDMIYGCRCDTSLFEGGLYDYTGHDCSLRTCPTGDDPSTEQGVHEVQTIACTATAGSFTVTFRQHTTAAISFDASAVVVKAALEAIDTIGTVTVTFDTGVTVCGTSAVTSSITFLTELGDLPAMTTTLTTVTSATVAEATKGTRENKECSDHGICDRQLGVCKCFPGYTSSDGSGGSGTRSDCGFRDSMYALGSA